LTCLTNGCGRQIVVMVAAIQLNSDGQFEK
jgi:hypothetical protein